MADCVRERGKRCDDTTKSQALLGSRRPGARRSEKVFESKPDAQVWLTRQGAAALDRTHIDPRRDELLVSELADAWCETWTEREPKTRAGYEAILRKDVLPRFGSRKVSSVTPEAISAA
jgi:hypothetical protein